MRDVVWVREGFPPGQRLCRLQAATNVDRSFHVMDEGQAVFEIAANDANIGEVRRGRIIEIEGHRSIARPLPANLVAAGGYATCYAGGAPWHRGQGFRTWRDGNGWFSGVKISLKKTLVPTGTVHAHLYSDSGNLPSVALATSTNTIACADLTTTALWYTFVFSPYFLTRNMVYHIVLDVTDAVQNAGNYISLATTYSTYPMASQGSHSTNLLAWTADPTYDMLIKILGSWSSMAHSVAPWIGWVDQLSYNHDDDTVTVECRDPAGKLAERHSGLTTARSGAAGLIARDLLYEMNSRNAFGVTWDDASEAGAPVKDIDLSGMTVFDALNKLADATGEEWWIVLESRTDRLEIKLHWGGQQGFDRSQQVYLRAGSAVSSLKYAQDLLVDAESILVVGGGASMSDRPTVVRAVNQLARAGLFGAVLQGASVNQQLKTATDPALAAERVIMASRETDINALAQIAARDLEMPRDAKETLSLVVNDRVDWRDLGTGDIVRLKHSTPWGALDRRIRVMETQPADTGMMALEVKVLDD